MDIPRMDILDNLYFYGDRRVRLAVERAVPAWDIPKDMVDLTPTDLDASESE